MRDDADALAVHVREADQNVGGPARLDLKEVTIVNDAMNDIVHVIWLSRLLGDHVIQRSVAPVRGVGRRTPRGL